MNNICYYMPTRILIGEQVLRQHPDALTKLGTSCLLVTGAHSARACGALDDVTAVLDAAGLRWSLFDEVTQNPLLSTCLRGAEAARAAGAEFIVGIGGGSPLDAAKAIAVLASNEGLSADDLFGCNWSSPALPIALVGTTAGTGSEVTPVSVLTIDALGRKKAFRHDQMYGRVMFGDPRYTAALNEHFTVSTGLDALAHCIEGYFSLAANAVSDLYALEGIRLLLATLPAIRGCAPESISPAQRESLYFASICGGATIAASGTCFCHALGYFLSEQHQIPHGVACALFLPEFLTRSEAFAPARMGSLCAALSTTPAAISAVLRSLVVCPALHLTTEEAHSLAQRYVGSGNYCNTPGGMTADEAAAVLLGLFS